LATKHDFSGTSETRADGRDDGREHWTDSEVDESAFKDARLGRRFGEVIRQIGDGMGESIPYACQDWANTKAAYRFFANDRVEEGEILSGHFSATRSRFAATNGPILLIQDTTEFAYQREAADQIGITKSVNSGRDKRGRLRHHTVCGMLMHSSLAVTIDGVPLGLSAVKFWTRKKFKAQPDSRGKSTRRAFQSRRRRACGGSTICDNPSSSWARRSAACMLLIGRTTSTSSTA
jgi:Transposase DNA-binding